jgi:hypothetical protein
MFHRHSDEFAGGARRIPGILAKLAAGFCFAAFFALLFGWLVQYLWNWLMPLLFSLKSITFWQAFGLVLLAKILFGGFGHGHPHSWHARHFGQMDRTWKPGGNYRNWQHYHGYWEAEGKKSFEDYLHRNGFAEKQP